MGHWYTKDGEPKHDSTLREARAENLFPSVTTILEELSKPQLEKWKIMQGIKVACEYCSDTIGAVYGPCYDIDDHKKIYNEWKSQPNEAADFGTTVHNLIHRYAMNERVSIGEYSEEIQDAYCNATKWINDNVRLMLSEKTYTSKQFGFAGTIDLIAKMNDGSTAIVDFKTQSVKKKLTSYPEWCYQLAAYKIMYEESANVEVDSCINIALASNQNSMEEFKWSDEKLFNGKIVFLSALNVYRYSRNFLYSEEKND